MKHKILPVLGSLLVMIASVGQAQPSNPPTMVNIATTFTLTGATGGKNATGTFTELFTTAGMDYTYASADGLLSDPTPYTYENLSSTTARIVESDVTIILDYNTNTTGTFVATYDDGGTQQGTFVASALVIPTPLLNISTRTTLSAGQTAIGGFIVGPGAGPRRVLVRGIGPTLANYGVANGHPDPKLTIYRGNSVIASVDDWDENAASVPTLQTAFAATGAFLLPTGSKDAAIVLTLDPGVYTAFVEGADSAATGDVLVEVYFVD